MFGFSGTELYLTEIHTETDVGCLSHVSICDVDTFQKLADMLYL